MTQLLSSQFGGERKMSLVWHKGTFQTYIEAERKQPNFVGLLFLSSKPSANIYIRGKNQARKVWRD